MNDHDFLRASSASEAGTWLKTLRGLIARAEETMRQTMAEFSDEAFEQYMQSRGQDASVALADTRRALTARGHCRTR
jgi:hypothetical protein